MKRESSEKGVKSIKLRRPTARGKASAKGLASQGPSVTRATPVGKGNGKPYHHGRKSIQKIMFTLLRVAAAINGLALVVIVFFLVKNGWRAINWTFLTQAPTDSMTKGGILPCIVGTLCLSLGAIAVALPIGVASAIYLHEYARPGRIVRVIRLGINNLAGVPSVVFGLFGLAFFVTWLHFGVSILAGALTLGVLSLPVIIGASVEALRAVFFTPHLPNSLFDKIMALPYHIYVLATAGTEIEKTRHLQYGTALVLIILVLGMNLIAIIYRSRLRRRMHL
jgi:phosphate transport system permease protein